MPARRIGLLILAMLVVAGLVFAATRKRPAYPEQRLPSARGNSPEQNKIVARRVFDDLFTQGRYGDIGQIYDGNCRVHFGNRTESLAQSVEEGKGWRDAAPDLVMTADQITADGDFVNVSWTARGTHTGHGHGIKPTGKRVLVRGTSRFRIENGKIIEAWNSEYRDDLFRQIGVPRGTALLYETAQDLRTSLDPVFEFFSGTVR